MIVENNTVSTYTIRQMSILDFEIGLVFNADSGNWKCTDIGTRVIVAVHLDTIKVAGGTDSIQTLSQSEAVEAGWFNGPPYAISEVVFDEYDMQGCRIDGDEALAA